MKSIREQQFEHVERKEKLLYAFTIAMTYIAISAAGSLFLMWYEGII